MIHVRVRVQRRRGEPQAFGAPRNRREVDRLDVDAVPGYQFVARLLAGERITHQHGHDMGLRRHHRNAGFGQTPFEGRRPLLVAFADLVVGLEVTHAGERARGDRRRHRRRENEAGSVGADEIAHRRGAGNVAADHAERLGQRSLDHADAVHLAVAFGDTGAARPVHADRMDLVEEGHRAVLVGNVADLANRRDVAVHGIDRLEGDQLGARRIGAGEHTVQVADVVVPEDFLFGLRVDDPFDHRIVVLGVGDHQAVRQHPAKGAERGHVRGPAGTEKQRRLGAVKIGQFAFEQHVIVVGAGNVAGSAGAGAATVECLVHGVEHAGMLSHAQIIVGAPDGDLLLLTVHMADRPGEVADLPLEVDEDAVTAFAPQRGDTIGEKLLVVHPVFPVHNRCRVPLGRHTANVVVRASATQLFPVKTVHGRVRPESVTHAQVSSRARPKLPSISSISAAVITSGGEKAMLSPSGRTISPFASARLPR